MEALTAVAAAGLALIDMVKARRPGRRHRRRPGAAQGGRQDRPGTPGGPAVSSRSGTRSRPAPQSRTRGRCREARRDRRAPTGPRPASTPTPAARCSSPGCASSASRSTEPVVVPDGAPVGEALRAAIADGVDVVLTSGGTGITPTDRTPEATRALLDYEIPGHRRGDPRAYSRDKVPTAALSRGLAGVAGPHADRQPARLDGRRRDGLPCSARSCGTRWISCAAATTGDGPPPRRRAPGRGRPGSPSTSPSTRRWWTTRPPVPSSRSPVWCATTTAAGRCAGWNTAPTPPPARSWPGSPPRSPPARPGYEHWR